MAPRRKRVLSEPREFKVRLPADISDRIEAKAEQKHQSQSRVIIDELAAFPDLERNFNYANLVEEMRNVLARYSTRITWLDLSEQLLAALDKALASEGSAQQAALDKCRVLRNAMVKTEAAKNE